MTGDALQPRLSILIPTRNRKEGLKSVIDSVLKDRLAYPNIEIVVIDGHSTDGTGDLLRSYGDAIVWKPQVSRGLYAALNEALALSTGDWVRMMADDDDYIPGVMEGIVAGMREHPECLGVGGVSSFESWSLKDESMRGDVGRVTGEMTRRSCAQLKKLSLFSHEAMYFRREPLVSVGGWDARFAVCADFDLQFRLLNTGGSFFVLPFEVLRAKRHAGSASVRQHKRAFFEILFTLLRMRQIGLIWHLALKRFKRKTKLAW